MSRSVLFQTAGALFLVTALSACVDANINLEVVDATHGVGTTTIAMDRTFYDKNPKSSDFCRKGELSVTESTATCVTTNSGTYEELFTSSDPQEPTPTVTTLENGMIRVVFPLGSLAEQAALAGQDPQTLDMLNQFFADHVMSVSVSGGQVTDSNMEIAEDGQSASLSVPFLDMVKGEVDVPEEAYAVIDLN